MTNYLLSIDPSIKNTGFTLWEKTKIISECEVDYREIEYIYKWKPILIKNYSFKKYDEFEFQAKIIREIVLKMSEPHRYYKSDESKQHYWLEDLEIIIERGFPNMMGSEKLDHLRGFIAGQFSHILKKEMLISPKEWQNWCLKSLPLPYFDDNKLLSWDKEVSIKFANNLIKQNNWNITISNHDEADSLLIGWYYLNKDEKNNEK